MRCSNCGADVPEGVICPECGAVVQSATLLSPSDVDPQRTLSSRYILLSLVGRGGMGAVFLAKDTKLDELVALKLLPQEFATDIRAIEWMREEVRLARSLAHPNIMRVYDLQTDTDRAVTFITMEFVDGVDVGTLMSEYGGRLPLPAALRVLRQAASAVDFAHSQRIVHRDIKPKNIMVDRRGQVKVTDFGIARRLRETYSKISQTVVAGTPVYMAPEALDGQKIDRRADVYSFGVAAYEMVTGRVPFTGTGMELMYRVLKAEMPPVEADEVQVGVEGMDTGEVAERLTAVFRRCLAKEAEKRYASCEEFVNAVCTAVGAEVVEAASSDKTLKQLCKAVEKAVAKQRRLLASATKSMIGTPWVGTPLRVTVVTPASFSAAPTIKRTTTPRQDTKEDPCLLAEKSVEAARHGQLEEVVKLCDELEQKFSPSELQANVLQNGQGESFLMEYRVNQHQWEL